MHLSEGVLSVPVLAGSAALSAAGVAIGLRSIDDAQIPRTGMMAATLFVVSLIHVPLGPASMHLTLVGLAGLVLGWAVFPAILVALLLQAVLFGMGGLTTLGANTLTFALPAILCRYLFLAPLRRGDGTLGTFVLGTLAGALGIALAYVVFAAQLLLSGREYLLTAQAILAAHLPVIVIEGLVTGSIVAAICQVRPELFGAAALPSLEEPSHG